jgi:hypothetical protein
VNFPHFFRGIVRSRGFAPIAQSFPCCRAIGPLQLPKKGMAMRELTSRESLQDVLDRRERSAYMTKVAAVVAMVVVCTLLIVLMW